MPDRLRSALHEGVLTVTLDRPDRLNAVTVDTLRAFLDLCDRARQPDVAVVVVTGAGRAFSAGQDLESLERDLLDDGHDEDAFRAQLAVFQGVTEAVLSHPKPFVAAVNGVAVGFGAELALACDVRLAATTARIGFVEATRALFQTNGVMWLLPRVVGHGNAARMLLTGELVDAAEAHRVGLVSSVHEPADLLPAAQALAATIRDNAPISTRLVKQVLARSGQESLEQVLEREVEGMLECLRSEDLREGTRAFLEGRRPAYRGV